MHHRLPKGNMIYWFFLLLLSVFLFVFLFPFLFISRFLFLLLLFFSLSLFFYGYFLQAILSALQVEGDILSITYSKT